MTDAVSESLNEDSIAFLLSLFQEHDISAVLEDDWVILVDYGLRATCAVYPHKPTNTSRTLQLDICLEINMGRALIESFAGIGATWEEALADAWRNFIDNSFHVILTAFFTDQHDAQITRETWNIDGEDRPIIIGNIGLRSGDAAVSNSLSMDWLTTLEEKIKEQPLAEGSHWIRVFYAQMNNEALSCEVLLDNETWIDLQDEMADFAWPAHAAFYSVRLFLIITE